LSTLWIDKAVRQRTLGLCEIHRQLIANTCRHDGNISVHNARFTAEGDKVWRNT